MESVTTEKKEEKYRIFGDVDKNKDGKVKSEYPSWYFTTHKEELEESIRHKENVLERDLVPASEKSTTRVRLKQEKERMDMIEAGQPKLSAKELDEIAKVIKSLGTKISTAMFSRSQMEKGVADAHEVARRWSVPCVELDAEEISFVKSCDVSVSNNGKVTQIGAEKAWKIGRRLIGEISNSEILRKP